jgi:ABC-2 type transport system ATP-binding protein
MNAIRIEGLQKLYGSVRALDGLDLSVESGTVFGFLGPNGSGKTTTIRLLTGLARPTAGRAWVAGVEIGQAGRHVRSLASRIGHLPEEPVFYPWMTPREFLDYVGRLFGLNANERATRSSELLELVGLNAAGKRRIGGFSRGMRQRLGLAQALVNRPEVLFLDEPVSALDPVGRKEVLELIEHLRKQCTIFMSTHILADVERVCDTVGIIARGRMVVQAQREALLNQYAMPILEIMAEANIGEWAATIRSQPWVQSVAVDGQVARVTVSDMVAAKRELLSSALGAGLAVTHYELVKPSLEDIFLRLVGEETQ